jgi:DNA-binding PadR family transcriptional regulator
MLRAVVGAYRNVLVSRRRLEGREHMPLLIGKSDVALLLFLLDSDQRLDPIRIMKGMFIFSMEAPETWLAKYERYRFIPYSYGPYSRDVDDSLDQLVEHGYVKISKMAGKSWNYYYLSDKGRQKAQELAQIMPPEAANYLRKIRDFVLRVDLRKLLDTVYTKYPSYATKSVFRR